MPLPRMDGVGHGYCHWRQLFQKDNLVQDNIPSHLPKTCHQIQPTTIQEIWGQGCIFNNCLRVLCACCWTRIWNTQINRAGPSRAHHKMGQTDMETETNNNPYCRTLLAKSTKYDRNDRENWQRGSWEEKWDWEGFGEGHL
jgi:hypothetical protein